MPKVKIKVSRSSNRYLVKVFRDRKSVIRSSVACAQETIVKILIPIILAYNPLPSKPPSVLAKEAIQRGSIEFPSPLAKGEA